MSHVAGLFADWTSAWRCQKTGRNRESLAGSAGYRSVARAVEIFGGVEWWRLGAAGGGGRGKLRGPASAVGGRSRRGRLCGYGRLATTTFSGGLQVQSVVPVHKRIQSVAKAVEIFGGIKWWRLGAAGGGGQGKRRGPAGAVGRRSRRGRLCGYGRLAATTFGGDLQVTRVSPGRWRFLEASSGGGWELLEAVGGGSVGDLRVPLAGDLDVGGCAGTGGLRRQRSAAVCRYGQWYLRTKGYRGAVVADGHERRREAAKGVAVGCGWRRDPVDGAAARHGQHRAKVGGAAWRRREGTMQAGLERAPDGGRRARSAGAGKGGTHTNRSGMPH
ncbi:uncharacterized protein LOC131860190 [Cryptomeria japonica]|uniref:uncharacterized protein LOC131860190 n=1 Tax=Cryptomeria japonica TaxID=3369 RepID=UPI0027DAA620|nr:uncharacterized protein LOC131860190 [Cryptomeria japonica]